MSEKDKLDLAIEELNGVAGWIQATLDNTAPEALNVYFNKFEMAWAAERVEKLLAELADKPTPDPEPPTLRLGATVRVLKDTKSINGLNLPAGMLLRVTSHATTMVTARIRELGYPPVGRRIHGDGLVVTVKVGDVEVIT